MYGVIPYCHIINLYKYLIKVLFVESFVKLALKYCLPSYEEYVTTIFVYVKICTQMPKYKIRYIH